MALAALFQLGVPRNRVIHEIKKLDLKGWSLRTDEVHRSGITAMRVIVKVKEAIQPERSWRGIRRMIRKASIPSGAESRALAIFSTLAQAEAEVHGVDVEEVHFHEIGAVDSIVDIVGVAVALDFLNAEVASSRVPVGRGHVMTRHGVLPLPAPATLRILEGVPVQGRDENVEFTTPTGAAILKSQAVSFGPLPPMIPEAVGYGSGSRPPEQSPGFLRAVLGKKQEEREGVWIVEANIDDSTPEVLAYAIERLMDAGASDAWCASIVMKKGRPAVVLSAIARTEIRDSICRLILSETSSIGVRYHRVERHMLERSIVTVKTRYGRIPVKVGGPADDPVNASPEFEACKKAAIKHRVPLKKVMAEALAAFLRR